MQIVEISTLDFWKAYNKVKQIRGMYRKSILLDLLKLKKKQSMSLISFYPRNSFDHRTCFVLNIFFSFLKSDTCYEYFKFHGRKSDKILAKIEISWNKYRKEVCKLRRNYE